MEAISYFQKRDIHRSASLQYRYATSNNINECDKQHYFPLSPNFCRAHSKKIPSFYPQESTESKISTVVEPQIYQRLYTKDLTTKKCVLTETAVSKRPILMEPNAMGSNLMIPNGSVMVSSRFSKEKKRFDKEGLLKVDSGLIEDAVPPRCSSPKYVKKCWDESSTSANDEHTYQFWADDFTNNIGPIAQTNGIAAWAKTPEWFPRFTYVCLMQPPVRKPLLKPSRTMTATKKVVVQPPSSNKVETVVKKQVFEPNATMLPERDIDVLNEMIDLESNNVFQTQKPMENMIDEGKVTIIKPSSQFVGSEAIATTVPNNQPTATMVSSKPNATMARCNQPTSTTAPVNQNNSTMVSAKSSSTTVPANQPISTTVPANQPTSTTVPVQQPTSTMAPVQQPTSTNSPPKSVNILSYLQKAVTPRSSRKISPTKSQNDAIFENTSPTSKTDEEMERRLSSAFQNLKLDTPPKDSGLPKSTVFRNINFENNDCKSNVERKMYFERKKSMSVRYQKTQTKSEIVETENMIAESKLGNLQRRNSMPFRRGNQIIPSSKVIKQDVKAINQIESKTVNFERRNSMPFRRPNQNSIVPSSNQNIVISSMIKEEIQMQSVEIEPKLADFQRRNSMPFRRPNQIISNVSSVSTIKEGIISVTNSIATEVTVSQNQKQSLNVNSVNNQKVCVSGSSVNNETQSVIVNTINERKSNNTSSNQISIGTNKPNVNAFSNDTNQKLKVPSSFITSNEKTRISNQVSNAYRTINQNQNGEPSNHQPSVIAPSINHNQKLMFNGPSISNQVSNTYKTINQNQNGEPSIITTSSNHQPSVIASSINHNQKLMFNGPSISNQVPKACRTSNQNQNGEPSIISTSSNHQPSVIASSINHNQKLMFNGPSISNQVSNALRTINQNQNGEPSIITTSSNHQPSANKPSTINQVPNTNTTNISSINRNQKPFAHITSTSAKIIKREQYFTKEPTMTSYTGSSRNKSRIFPDLLAPAQTIFVSGSNNQDQLIMSQLPSSYDQFCETVQYRPLIPNLVSYNRPINVNGNAGIW